MMVSLRTLALAAALLAPSLVPLPASAAILVQIDKSSQRMTVSKDGQTLYTWPVSTGKRGYSTPSGSYKAFRLEKDHFSKEWDDAPMPNSIFFTKDGHAIHGTFDEKRLGGPASHGCVRLSRAHAETLFEMVKADGVLNTQVVLTGVEPAYSPSAPVARAPRTAPADDGLDNQAYGRSYGSNPNYSGGQGYSDDRYPGYRYQQRAPIDDQRYAQDGRLYRAPQQPYGQQYQQPQYQQPQPYYGSRYRDPYYDIPPQQQPQPYYRRGY